MKICVVLYKFGTVEEIGRQLGSYAYFLRQLKEIKAQGVDLVVVAPWLSWLKKGSLEVEGIKVIRYWPKLASRGWRSLLLYKLINKVYIWRTGRVVLKTVSQENSNVIFVRQARETGFAVAKVKNKINLPIVFQPITTWRWHFTNSGDNWLRRIVKDSQKQEYYAQQLLSEFDYIITYNKSMQAEYERLGAQPTKFYVIPGAVDHKLFKPYDNQQELRQRLNLPVSKKLILYIGRINFAEKGLDYLLKAFKSIQFKSPNTHLILIGPGTTEQKEKLRRIIRDLNIKNKVSYLGKKNYEVLPEYINACDVGVVPSVWFESSGRTSLDMLSCGLPVVVTSVGGLPEYSVDQKTGLVVEPKDAEALAQALEKILSHDELMALMSQYARQYVLAKYTFANTTLAYINFFRKISS